jgi:predicted Fe-Mo cluster-binding NifX family protein
MRIAVTRWGERISPLFETAARLAIVAIDPAGAHMRFEAGMDGMDTGERIRLLRGLAIDLLICGAVARDTRARLAAAGIAVAGDVCGNWETALTAFLDGRLDGDHYFVNRHPAEALPPPPPPHRRRRP